MRKLMLVFLGAIVAGLGGWVASVLTDGSLLRGAMRVVRPPSALAWHREDETGQKYVKILTKSVTVGNQYPNDRYALDVPNARIYDVDFTCRSNAKIDNCRWNYAQEPCPFRKTQVGRTREYDLCGEIEADGKTFVSRRWEQNAGVTESYTLYYEVYR